MCVHSPFASHEKVVESFEDVPSSVVTFLAQPLSKVGKLLLVGNGRELTITKKVEQIK